MLVVVLVGWLGGREAIGDLAYPVAQGLEVSYGLDSRGGDHRQRVLNPVQILEGDPIGSHGGWLA